MPQFGLDSSVPGGNRSKNIACRNEASVLSFVSRTPRSSWKWLSEAGGKGKDFGKQHVNLMYQKNGSEAAPRRYDAAAKLLLICFAVLLVFPSFAQNLSLFFIDRGTEAIAYGAGITPYQESSYTFALGPYQSTLQGSDSGTGAKSGRNVVAYAFADLNSYASLSGNVLSVSGTGNCDTSQTANNGIDPQATEAIAMSSIQVNFSIDSPFYYSIQSDATSGGQGQGTSSVQLSDSENNIFSGSGILPAGSYVLNAISQLSSVGSAESDHSQFGVMLTVFPTNVPSTTTTVSGQPYKAAGCGCSGAYV